MYTRTTSTAESMSYVSKLCFAYMVYIIIIYSSLPYHIAPSECMYKFVQLKKKKHFAFINENSETSIEDEKYPVRVKFISGPMEP